MCLSGRCSRCQHRAIGAGVDHHDLAAVAASGPGPVSVARQPALVPLRACEAEAIADLLPLADDLALRGDPEAAAAARWMRSVAAALGRVQDAQAAQGGGGGGDAA